MAHVVDVAVARLETPLHTPFVTALRRTTALTSVVVRVTDVDGRTGFGEAPAVWRVTGESVPGIEACVLGPLRDVLIAWDLDAPALSLASVLDDAVVGNAGAKAACEVAMVDLVARRSGLPVHRLLGGDVSSVATDMTVAADAAPETAPALIAQGFRHLKVKVGVDPDDVARVQRIHQESGGSVRIRLDANQGWDVRTAISSITALLDAGVDVEFIEQPLARWDLPGHAKLRAELPVPIMLDESVFSPLDLQRAVDAGSADILNIKLAKCGGLAIGLELARLARSAGLDVMVGSMMESRLGVSAAAALAIAVAPESVHDLDAAWWSINPGEETPYQGNRYLLPDAPGLDPESRLLDPLTWSRSPSSSLSTPPSRGTSRGSFRRNPANWPSI